MPPIPTLSKIRDSVIMLPSLVHRAQPNMIIRMNTLMTNSSDQEKEAWKTNRESTLANVITVTTTVITQRTNSSILVIPFMIVL